MSHLYIPIDRALRDRLDALAQRERRHPREQAVVLLEQALRRVAAPEPRSPRRPRAAAPEPPAS
jgi:hypothetical protein